MYGTNADLLRTWKIQNSSNFSIAALPIRIQVDFVCPIGSLVIENVAQRVGECSVRKLQGFSVLECVKTGQREVSLIVSCVSLYFVLEHPVLTHSTKNDTLVL